MVGSCNLTVQTGPVVRGIREFIDDCGFQFVGGGDLFIHGDRLGARRESYGHEKKPLLFDEVCDYAVEVIGEARNTPGKTVGSVLAFKAPPFHCTRTSGHRKV